MKQTEAPKTWAKPALVHLGKIADVAGNKVFSNNGINTNAKS
jgi:predicted oxidoreductase (fatty acid repression mutant protein)